MTDHDISSPEVHAGHSPETGLLARVREWTDAFPWLRLGRTLRVAGAPTLVLLVCVTFALWWFGLQLMYGELQVPVGLYTHQPDVNAVGLSVPSEAKHLIWTVTRYLRPLQPVFVFLPRASWWDACVTFVWSVLVWSPSALMLTRQGALLTAGRPMTGLALAFRIAWRRCPTAWLSAAIPLACVLAIGLMIVITGWMSRLFAGITWIEFSLAVMVALIAIPCGVLAFGANFAIPLSWAAIANEREGDALDSLSRGYEYLLRRPLKLALYLLVSFVALFVVWMLSIGVTGAASLIAARVLAVSGAAPEVYQNVQLLLEHLPVAISLTLFWGLVGGVYLLLRYDAGGQEVEDLWQPDPEPKPPLPQLPTTTETNP